MSEEIKTPAKPGVKSSEFWLTILVVLIGALPSSGLLSADSPLVQIVGLIGAVLAGLGYTHVRGKVKSQ